MSGGEGCFKNSKWWALKITQVRDMNTQKVEIVHGKVLAMTERRWRLWLKSQALHLGDWGAQCDTQGILWTSAEDCSNLTLPSTFHHGEHTPGGFLLGYYLLTCCPWAPKDPLRTQLSGDQLDPPLNSPSLYQFLVDESTDEADVLMIWHLKSPPWKSVLEIRCLWHR